MKIKFWIKNFRNLTNGDKILEIQDCHLNYLFGENSSGKSNFLDAIYWFFDLLENENIETQLTSHGLRKLSETYRDKNKLEMRIKFEIERLLSNDSDFIEVIDFPEIIEKLNIKNKFENDNFSLEFSKTTDNSYIEPFFNFFENKLTDISVLFNEIYEINKELWADNLFQKKDYPNNLSVFLPIQEVQVARTKIMSQPLNKVSKEEKEKIVEDYKLIYAINEKITSNIPSLLNEYFEIHYIKEFDKDKLIGEFNLSVLQNKKTEDYIRFSKVLSLLKDSEKNLLEFYNMNDEGEVNKSKKDEKSRFLEENYNSEFRELFKKFGLKNVPEVRISNSKFKISIGTDNNDRLFNISTPDFQSSGFKCLFWIIISILGKKNNKDVLVREIFLIDEPDKNIHYFVQQNLAEFLSKEIINTKLFVLITSHSPFIISDFYVSNINLVKTKTDGSCEIQKINDIKDIYDITLMPLLSRAAFNVWTEKYKSKYKDSKDIHFLINENVFEKLTDNEKSKIKDYLNEIYINKKFNINLRPISSTEEVLHTMNQNIPKNLVELTSLINSYEYPAIIFLEQNNIDKILELLN